jgi:hypothetical protein
LNEKINYINAHCTISNNTVCKNGEKVFAGDQPSIANFLLSLYDFLKINYPKFYKMDDLCKLGWLASEILLKDDFKNKKYLPDETAIVFANSNSSLDTDIKYLNTVKDIASPSLFVYTLPNIVTGEICIRNNFKGENAFVIFDSFNAFFFERYVNDLMNNDAAKACICGWVDLLENDYKAVLFLVEKEKKESFYLFSTENMNKIFKSANCII